MSPPVSPLAETAEPRLRLDKWLWYARFHKSRTLAAAVCAGGRIRLNGTPVTRAHQMVKPGDVLTFPYGKEIRVVRIVALGERRGPALEARTLYEAVATPEAGPPADDAAAVVVHDSGPGRPTRTERRALERLRGRWS